LKNIAAASVLRRTALSATLLLLTPFAISQTPPQTPAQTPQPDQINPTTPHGKILFNRNQDNPQAEKQSTLKQPTEPTEPVTDDQRAALIFTAYDLDVHLVPAQSHLAIHARFSVKNTGKAPLPRLIFQISSSLQWESFASDTAGRATTLPFTIETTNTDSDHTGKATEAIVTLPQSLEPGATLELTSLYSGEITQSAERLERIGAPADQAARADWDQITPAWIALRGYGNVLWYPTAAIPAFLGDGAKLFQSVGQTKLQQAAATIHLRLTMEYIGDAPDAAFFCGRREQLKVTSENQNVPVAESPGIATADFAPRTLGFRTPSLFVTDHAGTLSNNSLISAITDHYDALPNYDAASEKAKPLLTDWLGPGPLSVLTILDHNGQPFEDDALVVAPMRATPPDTIAPALVHSLSHAWFRSSHVWLDEGVPQFLSLLWMEQTQGRQVTVTHLQEEAKALALAEPAVAQSNSTEEGQSLIAASDEIYYRTKAAAVLEMLRSIVGEDALKHALKLYRDNKQDADPKEFQRVLEQTSHRDLNWFFDDWVYRDRGLPDLSIASVTPRQLDQVADKGTGYLVSIEVRNEGDAAAEVPITLRSGTLTVTQRLRISARSSASTRIVFAGTPTEVLVNDGTVPETSSSIHTRQILAH
jgi:hypothetical protein